jgi:hypothetical protein
MVVMSSRTTVYQGYILRGTFLAGVEVIGAVIDYNGVIAVTGGGASVKR